MMSYHPDAMPSHAPPSPPNTPRSPPITSSRLPQAARSTPISYAVDRRNSSFDDGDVPMDESIVRQIWLKLGLLDTISYKIDETLKKLSTLENRMDRLETTVREAGNQRLPGAVNGAAGLDESEDSQPLIDLKDNPPKKLPKPFKTPRPLIPSRPAPSAVQTSAVQENPAPFPQSNPTPFSQANPTPFTQTNSTPFNQANPTPFSQANSTTLSPANNSPQANLAPFGHTNQVNPIPKPPHQVISAATNVLPRSCILNITNKEECERKLRMHKHNGMYLIRRSDKTPNAKVLMVWFQEDGICKHYKIFGDQISVYQLDENPAFSSLKDLIEYYKESELPQSSVLLTKPYPG